MHIQLANGIVALFKSLQKVEHDVFRGGESISLLLLDWISRSETEVRAIEQTLAELGSLL